MVPILRVVFAWFCVLAINAVAQASETIALRLHGRVELSDTIVLGRVVDPERALVAVDRVVKGDAPKQITLVAYVDSYMRVADQKRLVRDARELMFLNKKGDAYAPLQNQHGRLTVSGGRLSDASPIEPGRLSDMLASIERLIGFQTRAARGGDDADRAYVEALRHSDVEVRNWAFDTADHRIKAPSKALAGALLAHWPRNAGDVANVVQTWRLREAAPLFAKTLATSRDGILRADAARALGGMGDVTYVPLLRRVASTDTYAPARSAAYSGIMDMLGPDSLADLRRAAKDPQEGVRAQAAADAYNLLELEGIEPRWPPASSALIAEVRTLLTDMLDDRSPVVINSARSMLAYIAERRP